MKHILLYWLASGIAITAAAQAPYPPAPAAAANITRLEYYIDRDPGPGNGTPVTITPSAQLAAFSFNADLTGVPNGFHRIYLRSMDATGAWSLAGNAYFDNVVVPAYPPAPPAAGNIVRTEYFIDTDPGFGNGTPLTVPVAAEIPGRQLVIDITGLTPGPHRLYIRVMDAEGKWSLTGLSQFDNTSIAPYPEAPSPAGPVGELEFFIDTDPGFGNGTAIPITAGTDITNLSVDIPLASLAPGSHTVYIRSRQNPWSLVAYADFMYASTLPLSWLYVQAGIQNDKGLLQWATAQEINTSVFEIEHSTDGRQFSKAGEVNAAGNSSHTETYRFLHDGLQQGMNYYRIRQVDLDGKYSYSKVVTIVYRNDAGETIIAPNPVGNILHIIMARGQAAGKVEVTDMWGRTLVTRSLTGSAQGVSMDVAGLAPGSYVVRIYYKSGLVVRQILKR